MNRTNRSTYRQAKFGHYEYVLSAYPVMDVETPMRGTLSTELGPPVFYVELILKEVAGIIHSLKAEEISSLRICCLKFLY